ncbi:hypothetical protein [Paenibacillus medicaginis]|uniref:Uncharacterized protein n=1 Tax=Paenibacillus medicaginis TaxID=1470560 RepID=A0ABV5BZZ6_9BACL
MADTRIGVNISASTKGGFTVEMEGEYSFVILQNNEIELHNYVLKINEESDDDDE